MQLLEQLVTTAGVPGREHRIRDFIRQQAENVFDEIHTDTLGSLIGIRRPHPKKSKSNKTRGKPLKVMLAAHMDQIGFMVSHVDDKGFLRVNPVGGFDARNLFARLCLVCPELTDPSKDMPGVLNPTGKPIHVASDDEKKKVPELHEFAIDLGLKGKEVKQKVSIGDMVVLQSPFQQVGRTVVSQCLDNRVACWILIRALSEIEHHDCEIQAVFTVQEEVGLRGAGTAAYSLEPDIGIAVDTTLCIDTPGVPEEQRVTQQGHGAALTIMDSASIADLELFKQFETIAQQRDILHQRSILSRGGTDSGTMQRSRTGIRTLTLSCPTRYIHTVTEMVHLDDLHACRDLLRAYLEHAH